MGVWAGPPIMPHHLLNLPFPPWLFLKASCLPSSIRLPYLSIPTSYLCPHHLPPSPHIPFLSWVPNRCGMQCCSVLQVCHYYIWCKSVVLLLFFSLIESPLNKNGWFVPGWHCVMRSSMCLGKFSGLRVSGVPQG